MNAFPPGRSFVFDIVLNIYFFIVGVVCWPLDTISNGFEMDGYHSF